MTAGLSLPLTSGFEGGRLARVAEQALNRVSIATQLE